MSIITIDDWVTYFRGFVRATLTSSSLKNTWVHTFRLDQTLLDLEVYSFTSICFKVSTQLAQNLTMQWYLIRDKILLSLSNKMQCKCFMGVVDLCRRGVSYSNGDGYNPSVAGDVIFIHIKVPTRSVKTSKEKLNSGRTTRRLD